jgi:hypothetical protein
MEIFIFYSNVINYYFKWFKEFLYADYSILKEF